MKANITNLRKALKVSASAHNCKFHDWSKEGHFSLESDTPATICDVQLICEAFFGEGNADVESTMGYTIAWICYSEFLPEVDERTLALALPYGTKLE